jgi:putative heme iron utilization protein
MLDKKTGDYAAARDVYVARFPSSEMVFSLGDFNLYELVPKKGRFVIAFGRAFNVTAETLRELA